MWSDGRVFAVGAVALLLGAGAASPAGAQVPPAPATLTVRVESLEHKVSGREKKPGAKTAPAGPSRLDMSVRLSIHYLSDLASVRVEGEGRTQSQLEAAEPSTKELGMAFATVVRQALAQATPRARAARVDVTFDDVKWAKESLGFSLKRTSKPTQRCALLPRPRAVAECTAQTKVAPAPPRKPVRRRWPARRR